MQCTRTAGVSGYGLVTSKTRLFGFGPNDGHGTTAVWLTPGFDQSHTPPEKTVLNRVRSGAHRDV